MSKQSEKPTTTVVLPTLMVLAALNKGIDELCKSATELQGKVGELGLQALMHLAKNGDIGPANRLLVGLPKGMRRNALASWMLTHGALDVNTDAGTRKTQLVKFAKGKVTNPEAAMADPWFSHQPEKPIDTVFDLQRAIHVLLQRAKGKDITVHGKTLSAEDATDRLRAMAAMVGEDFDPAKGPVAKEVAPAAETATS